MFTAKYVRTAVVVVIAAIALTTSCTKKSDDPAPYGGFADPTVTLVSTNLTIKSGVADIQGDSIAKITVKASAPGGLQSLKFNRQIGLIEYPLGEAALGTSATDFTLLLPYRYTDTASVVTLNFVATDKYSRTAKYSVTLNAAPTIQITDMPGTKFKPGTVPLGDSAGFKINLSSIGDLASVVATATSNGKTRTFRSKVGNFKKAKSFDTTWFMLPVSTDAPGKPIRVDIIATDKSGHKSTSSITYTYLNQILVINNLKLSHRDFFSVVNGQLYPYKLYLPDGTTLDMTGKNNSQVIDFLYLFKAGVSSFVAPSNTVYISPFYGNFGNNPAFWTTKNGTLFRESTLDPPAFDQSFPASNAQNLTILQEFYTLASSTPTSKINADPDKLIAFKTADNRYGIIKTSNPDSVGTINIRYQSYK